MQDSSNPFNPTTVISYQLPAVGKVTLKIYDALGREITTLVNGEQPTGSYAVRFNGEKLSSGVYFCRLQMDNYSKVTKMILLK